MFKETLEEGVNTVLKLREDARVLETDSFSLVGIFESLSRELLRVTV